MWAAPCTAGRWSPGAWKISLACTGGFECFGDSPDAEVPAAAATLGHAEEVIAEVVKHERIDLLGMGAYGHSRIRRLIVGSTTTTMIRTCLVPVLMFR